MDSFEELLDKYRDVVIGVYKLGTKCCGNDCIIRVTDWDYVKTLRCSIYGLMIDSEQADELLRHPSLIKALLEKGISRLIAYPCFGYSTIDLLRRLGFTVMNYVTEKSCPLTPEVVIHPNAYETVSLVKRGIITYVHLYNPYLGKKLQYDIKSIFDVIFEYLRKANVKVYLILDMIDH